MNNQLMKKMNNMGMNNMIYPNSNLMRENQNPNKNITQPGFRDMEQIKLQMQMQNQQ